MRASLIQRGKTYVGKSSLQRTVDSFRICGVSGSEPIGDIYYTPIDRKGKKGKQRGVSSESIARWALGESVN